MFESTIETLLADPQYADHPLHTALVQLLERYQEQVKRIERIARISDGYQRMLHDFNKSLQFSAATDPLTGLVNRRVLLERVQAETARARRHGDTFVVGMLDVDYFKSINDRYGHDAGDRALVEIGRALLGARLRDYDVCGRWGGEEFLILLPNTTLAETAHVAARVRSGLASLQLEANGECFAVSASIGWAEHLKGEDGSETINRADAGLLRAKQEGRNRSVFIQP